MPAPNDPARMESLVDHVLYRVAGERDVSAESIILPLRRRIPGRYLIATFRNGDSPPLRITGAKIRCYPTVLAYYADSAGAWQLLTGCRDAKAPDYDLSPLRGALAAAGGHRTLPGTPQAKPDYQAPPALPGVGTAGAEISLTAWSRRRAVHAATAGVIRVELDEKALAGCRDDLGDLRLVRNGRQIPYLVQRSYAGSAMRDLKPSKVTELNDPKRPTVSRWEITLPVANLPAVDVTARSPSPLFTRRFVVTIQRKDVLGNVWTDNAGTADWTKSGGDDSRLVLGLGRQRLTQTFILETDNGDNPPIDLADIAVRSAGASVTAKLVGDDPLFLYYGNPKATPPQYDLRLAGDELIAADQHAANLGDEEILHPDARQTGAADAGSPWLWLALAGVVAVLLVIVAKLLPRPTVG